MSVSVVSDGTLLMDGGCVFGPVPRVQWEGYLKPDRRNRVRLSLNCLLVRADGQNVLIDTGAGSKRLDQLREAFALSGNKLGRGLKAQGLSPRDIDKVVLTNLRFDRAGGCTKLDRTGKVLPTFPRATYIVQRAALEDARDPGERSAPLYHSNDLLPLEEAGMVRGGGRDRRGGRPGSRSGPPADRVPGTRWCWSSPAASGSRSPVT